MKATEIMDEYKLAIGLDPLFDDDDTIAEEIVKLYLMLRLRPLLGIAKITLSKLNNICDNFADNYFDYNISIDLMCNSLYNYINSYNKCPAKKLLSTNIEELLKEYGGTDE